MPTTQGKELYLEAFSKLEKQISRNDAAWLKSFRAKALLTFGETGFPTTKNEAWKYTDLSTGLLKVPFEFETSSSTPTALAGRLKATGFETEKAHLVVFVNGHFSKELSSLKPLPAGVKLSPLSAALSDSALQESLGQVISMEGRALTALNTAYFTDGLYLQVGRGKAIAEPIHAVHLSVNGGKATQSHPRNLILMDNDGQAVVIEHYLGDNAGAYLTNSVTEIRLGHGAKLEHVKIQQEDGKAYHVGSLATHQAEGSQLVSRVFSIGSIIARTETETLLTEKKAECMLDGLYLGKGKQHLDQRTFVDHQSASCQSQQTYKGVVDNEATGIFDGSVLVRENAQKTDARQSNKNLQLSKDSKVYSKPQLQIYADDVKCSHGSATGQMDEEALFYFQSRGISREDAKKTLVYAFAAEMVDKVTLDYLKVPLRKMVNEWMGEKS